MEAEEIIDVCINGGGPVGLFAAYLLLYQNRQAHRTQVTIRRSHTIYPVLEKEDEDNEEEDNADCNGEERLSQKIEEKSNNNFHGDGYAKKKTKTIQTKIDKEDFVIGGKSDKRLNQKYMNRMVMNLNSIDIPVLTNQTVRIFDKNSSRTSLSKALVLQSRTLEILYSCGLYHRFEPYFDRNAMLECHFFNYVPTLKIQVNAGLEKKTLIPYMAIIPQSETERILEEALWEEFGVKVERNMEMKEFVLESNNKRGEVLGVKCTYFKLEKFIKETGRKEIKETTTPSNLIHIKAKYLLGCDGAHSIIRKQLGISFEGEKLEGDFSMVDTTLLNCRNIDKTGKNVVTVSQKSGNSTREEQEESKREQATSEIIREGKEDVQDFEGEGMKKSLLPHKKSQSGSCIEIFVGFQGLSAIFHMPKYGFSRIIVPNLNKPFSSNNTSTKARSENESLMPLKMKTTGVNQRNPTITTALLEDEKKNLYDDIYSFLKQHDDRFLSRNLEMRNPTWITRFKVQERLASCYHSGKDSKPSAVAKRVFICGDAAHIHSPLGGQGMNMGLGDVWNLTWKINYALNYLNNKNNYYVQMLKSSEEEVKKGPVFFGLSSPNINNSETVIDELVASYDKERRQVAETVLKNTTIGTKFLLQLTQLRILIKDKKIINFLFHLFLKILVGFLYISLQLINPFILSPKAASNISQLNIQYHSNDQERESEGTSKPYLSAGQQVNTVGVIIKCAHNMRGGEETQVNSSHSSDIPLKYSGNNTMKKISILHHLDTIHHLIVVFTERKRHTTYTEIDFLEIANFPKVYLRKMLLLDPYRHYPKQDNKGPPSLNNTYLCGSVATIISDRNEVYAFREIFGLTKYVNFFQRLKKRKPSPTFRPKRDNFSYDDIPFFFIIRPDGHLAYTNCLY